VPRPTLRLLLSPALPCRQLLQHADSLRLEMLEIGPVLDGSKQRSRNVPERVVDASGDCRNKGVPSPQGAEEPVHIAMLGVPRIVANSHVHAGSSDLVEQ